MQVCSSCVTEWDGVGTSFFIRALGSYFFQFGFLEHVEFDSRLESSLALTKTSSTFFPPLHSA